MTLTRRDLVRLVGISVAATAIPALQTTRAGAATFDPQIQALAGAFFLARNRAIETGRHDDALQALSFVSPSNPSLREHLAEEIRALNRSVNSQGPLLSVAHDLQFHDQRGSVVNYYSRTRWSWRNSTPPTGSAGQDPRTAADPRPVIESSIGYELTLDVQLYGGVPKIARAGYRGVAWDSPDRTALAPVSAPGSWRGAAPRPVVVTRNPDLAAALSSNYYYWDQAVNYCYTYNGAPGTGTNYNPNYYNYNSLGGDCTSFVSQACANAGWIAGDRNDPTAYWYDPAVAPWVGYAWYSADYQRPWIINNFRGYDIGGSPQGLGRGDIIYYDWADPYSGSSVWDHTVMVTTIPASGRRLIDCHNPDLHEADWETVWASYLSPFSTSALHLNATY